MAFAKTEHEQREIIDYLITGQLPGHQRPPVLTGSQVYLRLEKRYDQIVSRHRNKVHKGRCPLVLNDLVRIYVDQSQTCQITGVLCHLHNPKYAKVPYWALTFDHITPVSHRLNDPSVWAARNLQIMSCVLNNVKNDAKNIEIIDWYKRFLKAKTKDHSLP
ncbi:hypothetical protein EDC96DRAFT_172676 [Choanephora cucurbitarum]|nr:hypothetical protein EDC96DRAFT_172676 [Choanephora cucurbitarum]